MSNRTMEQASALAELKASHEAQIEALTAPGLSGEDRLHRFAAAACFREDELDLVLHDRMKYQCSAAFAAWQIGRPPLSLFAHMPGCGCPVIEVGKGKKFDGIPAYIEFDWQPDRAQLECFARVQQQARFPEPSQEPR